MTHWCIWSALIRGLRDHSASYTRTYNVPRNQMPVAQDIRFKNAGALHAGSVLQRRNPRLLLHIIEKFVAFLRLPPSTEPMAQRKYTSKSKPKSEPNGWNEKAPRTNTPSNHFRVVYSVFIRIQFSRSIHSCVCVQVIHIRAVVQTQWQAYSSAAAVQKSKLWRKNWLNAPFYR